MKKFLNYVIVPGLNMKSHCDKRKILKIQKAKADQKISFFNF